MTGKRGTEILFFVVDDKFFSNVFMDMSAMNGDKQLPIQAPSI
jgi:hypothetical protein